jgi:hypothetical protein
MKDSFDHRVVPFTRGSLSADSAIPQFIQDTERMISCSSTHRRGVPFGLSTVISPVSVHDLAFLGEIYLATVNGCGGRFELANEAKIRIHFAVEFIAEIGFAAFLCP